MARRAVIALEQAEDERKKAFDEEEEEIEELNVEDSPKNSCSSSGTWAGTAVGAEAEEAEEAEAEARVEGACRRHGAGVVRAAQEDPSWDGRPRLRLPLPGWILLCRFLP
jgi:hypothetical protein